MTLLDNSLAPRAPTTLTEGVGNSADTTNPSLMYHDVSSAGDGVSVSSRAKAARSKVPTFRAHCTETIPCKGSQIWSALPSGEFSRQTIWHGLFGKKRCLPASSILKERCPYAEINDSWKNDPEPVSLGSGFFMFFSDLLEIERAFA